MLEERQRRDTEALTTYSDARLQAPVSALRAAASEASGDSNGAQIHPFRWRTLVIVSSALVGDWQAQPEYLPCATGGVPPA